MQFIRNKLDRSQLFRLLSHKIFDHKFIMLFYFCFVKLKSFLILSVI